MVTYHVSTTQPTHIEEANLVQLLRQQDKLALELIYQNYRHALFGTICRILKDERLAEDVFQECLVKFWRYGPTYDPKRGRVFTWMLNICRNAAIDKTRSKEFKYQAKIQSDDELVHSQTDNVKYEIPTDQIGLGEMVNKLEPKYKELIDLVYFGGRSQREAAKELDLPVGTVKTRLRTAIGMMRQWIKA